MTWAVHYHVDRLSPTWRALFHPNIWQNKPDMGYPILRGNGVSDQDVQGTSVDSVISLFCVLPVGWFQSIFRVRCCNLSRLALTDG
jgi:hypothetical protein